MQVSQTKSSLTNNQKPSFQSLRTRFFSYEIKPQWTLNEDYFVKKNHILKNGWLQNFANFLDKKGYDVVAYLKCKSFERALETSPRGLHCRTPYDDIYERTAFNYHMCNFAVMPKKIKIQENSEMISPSYIWNYAKRNKSLTSEEEAKKVLNIIEQGVNDIKGKFIPDKNCPTPYIDEIQKNQDLNNLIENLNTSGTDVNLSFEHITPRYQNEGWELPRYRLILTFEDRYRKSVYEDYKEVSLVIAQNSSRVSLLNDIKNFKVKPLEEMFSQRNNYTYGCGEWNSQFPDIINNPKPRPQLESTINVYGIDLDNIDKKYMQELRNYELEARKSRELECLEWEKYLQNNNS